VSARLYAEAYLEAGWVPLPIATREKGPREQGWSTRTLTTVRESFDRDFRAGEEMNVGVLLGEPSGGLTDLDLDCEEAVELAPLFLPPTMSFGRESRRKSHLIYKSPGSKTNQFKDPVDGKMLLEIRSGGCQTVFPGSIHPTGEEIEFTSSEQNKAEPIPAEHLLKRASQLAVAVLLKRHFPGEGSRHNSLLAVAGGLLQDGLDDEVATRILECVCPALANEANVIVRSTRQNLDDERKVTSWGSLVKDGPIDRRVASAVSKWLCADKCADNKDAHLKRGDHTELAARLLSALGQPVSTEDALWRYESEDGLYRRIGVPEQSRAVQKFAGSWIERGTNKNGEPKLAQLSVNAATVAGTVELAKHRAAQEDFFANAPDGLAFADCFIALTRNGLERRPHSEANRARAGFNFVFEKGELPSKTIDCLQQAFEGEPDVEDRIRLLQEFGGACLFGIAPRYQIALVLLSEDGETAKSTTIALLAGAMAPDTTSAIAPQLFGDQYRRAKLVGIRLNAVNELPTTDIADSESFKSIITGDPIDARHIRDAPFTLHPIAGHIFATNRLPPIADISSAFFRRLCVLRYSRVVPKDKRIVGLAEQIVAEERAAIVSWLVEGAEALIARGRYILPASSAAEINKWRTHADSVSSFVADECERKVDEWGGAMGIYQSYRVYCLQGGFHAVNMNTFSGRLVAQGIRRRQVSKGTEYEVQLKLRSGTNTPPFLSIAR